MTKREDNYAWTAARVLREQWPAASGTRPGPHRDQIVAAMELEMAKGRRRRWVAVGVGLAMSAAAALLVGLRLASPGAEQGLRVERVDGQGNLLVRAASLRALSTATKPVAGDEVKTDEQGGVTLGLRGGTRLLLSRASRLRVDAVGPLRRFSLLRGQVEAEVATLAPQERFVVDTPDAEVEVRGTRFSVGLADAPADCAETRSLVAVHEGAVWVRSRGREIVLGPGESWTAPCLEPATSAKAEAAAGDRPAPVGAAPPPAAAPGPSAPRRPSARPPSERVPPAGSTVSEPSTSDLAEQNDLLSAAMAAERAGEHDLALRELDQLLARFPDGPLSETARIERQRIRAAVEQSNQPNGPNGR